LEDGRGYGIGEGINSKRRRKKKETKNREKGGGVKERGGQNRG
jgi:hypothetical protein